MNKVLGLNAFLRDSTKFILKYQHHLLTPTKQRHDDVWLVEFPKSGVTWLSFLLANINLRCSGIDRQVTFFNIHDFVPDVGQSRHIKDSALPFPGQRFIKSHAQYNPYYNKVIYIIRDPRDVMVSYYHFIDHLGYSSGSISDLIATKRNGIDAWCKHVNGWFKNVGATQQFNIIRFEDLKRDTSKVLHHIYRLLGYEINDEVLEFAIKHSSFEAMKAQEEYYRAGNPKFSVTSMCRKGVAGSYVESLSKDDIKFVTEKAGELMEKFGYRTVS